MTAEARWRSLFATVACLVGALGAAQAASAAAVDNPVAHDLVAVFESADRSEATFTVQRLNIGTRSARPRLKDGWARFDESAPDESVTR